PGCLFPKYFPIRYVARPHRWRSFPYGVPILSWYLPFPFWPKCWALTGHFIYMQASVYWVFYSSKTKYARPKDTRSNSWNKTLPKHNVLINLFTSILIIHERFFCKRLGGACNHPNVWSWKS